MKYDCRQPMMLISTTVRFSRAVPINMPDEYTELANVRFSGGKKSEMSEKTVGTRQASRSPRRMRMMQSYQNLVQRPVPIEVKLQAIAARQSSHLRETLSARMPVNKFAVAKKSIKVAPASTEYLVSPKFGIA